MTCSHPHRYDHPPPHRQLLFECIWYLISSSSHMDGIEWGVTRETETTTHAMQHHMRHHMHHIEPRAKPTHHTRMSSCVLHHACGHVSYNILHVLRTHLLVPPSHAPQIPSHPMRDYVVRMSLCDMCACVMCMCHVLCVMYHATCVCVCMCQCAITRASAAMLRCDAMRCDVMWCDDVM